jgi:hypothetical protein
MKNISLAVFTGNFREAASRLILSFILYDQICPD